MPLKASSSTEEKTSFWGKSKPSLTKITVKYDCGYPNYLTIRGSGIPHLSWEKGIPLKNTRPNEWVFETSEPFKHGEFKILINDQAYENGPNRTLKNGITTEYSPSF